jgi:hypothetical protein
MHERSGTIRLALIGAVLVTAAAVALFGCGKSPTAPKTASGTASYSLGKPSDVAEFASVQNAHTDALIYTYVDI